MKEAKRGRARQKMIRAIKAELAAHGVPEDAVIMQAYMKSSMPNYGVKMPVMRGIVRAVDRAMPLESAEDFSATVLSLWRKAKFREERHAAIDLTRQRRYDEFQSLNLMPLYEEMIVEGAWWDYVDSIAPYRVGELLSQHPLAMKRKMLSWGKSQDIWKRRTSIICQLKFDEETDEELLFTNILASAKKSEFFLRKGIGWALREYGKKKPKSVLRFVKQHRADLSFLSKREGLRRIMSKEELAKFLR